MWQSFVNWIGNIFQSIWNWIVDFLYYSVGWAFQYVWNFIVEKANGLLSSLASLIPSFGFDFSFVTSEMWVLINEWIPVAYGFSCLGIYVGIALTVYAINWALGVIPTVS